MNKNSRNLALAGAWLAVLAAVGVPFWLSHLPIERVVTEHTVAAIARAISACDDAWLASRRECRVVLPEGEYTVDESHEIAVHVKRLHIDGPRFGYADFRYPVADGSVAFTIDADQFMVSDVRGFAPEGADPRRSCGECPNGACGMPNGEWFCAVPDGDLPTEGGFSWFSCDSSRDDLICRPPDGDVPVFVSPARAEMLERAYHARKDGSI